MDAFRDILVDLSVYIVTGCIAYIAMQVHQATHSIKELNERIAVILEKLSYHEKELARHEGRINKLETEGCEKWKR